MGYSLGFDSNWNRDIGYGVTAWCDHPQCWARIDRGLAHVCGGESYGGDKGCGLYFCGHHLYGYQPQRCPRCARYAKKPYTAKVEHPDWVFHKLKDESWAEWRAEHPEEVVKLELL